MREGCHLFARPGDENRLNKLGVAVTEVVVVRRVESMEEEAEGNDSTNEEEDEVEDDVGLGEMGGEIIIDLETSVVEE